MWATIYFAVHKQDFLIVQIEKNLLICKHFIGNTYMWHQTTVYYSRPKNVRDYVSKAKLHQATGRENNKFYTGESIDDCFP